MNKKSIWKILLVFALVFGMVFAPLQPAFAATVDRELTILHTNDVHGRESYDEKNGVIGYSRYKTIADEKRAAGPTLLVDVGDVLHGTNFATLSKGESMAKLMNAVGVEVMVPGNHDFNYGADRLLEIKNTIANFDVLAANVVKEDGTKPFTSYKIIDKDGIKVGLFGIATPETKYKSSPANTVGLDFDAVVPEAQKAIEALKADGAEVIVFLSHLGLDESSTVNTKTVLDQITNKADIDVVIDGHSHHTFETGFDYNGTLIASTGNYLNNIGEVKIKLAADGTKTVSAGLIKFADVAAVTPDQPIEDMIAAANAENAVVLAEVIGNTATELDGERPHVRAGITNLSVLIADSMLKETGADLAITNGGGIRASIDAGEITMDEALTVLPFGNLVTVIEVTGQDVYDALVHGTSDYPNAKGAFPQVAGMKYTLYIGLDGSVKVQDVTVGGQALDLAKTYKVATNDFMAIGGDAYTMFEGSKQVSLHGLMVDIFADHIKELSANGPFTSVADDRLTVKYEPDFSGNTPGEMNIRDAANGQIIATVPAFTLVEGLTDQENPDWMKITYNGVEGYIYKPLLAAGVCEGYAMGQINARKYPNGEILDVVNKGAYVKGVYYNTPSTWVQFNYNGKKVFVYRSLLQKAPVVEVKYSAGVINLRDDANGKVIGSIPKYTKLEGTIHPVRTNWLKVTYDGKEGYVYRPLLVNSIVKLSGATIGMVNVRSSAGMAGKVLGSLPKGYKVSGTVVPLNSGWLEIDYYGRTAYIWKEFVK